MAVSQLGWRVAARWRHGCHGRWSGAAAGAGAISAGGQTGASSGISDGFAMASPATATDILRCTDQQQLRRLRAEVLSGRYRMLDANFGPS